MMEIKVTIDASPELVRAITQLIGVLGGMRWGEARGVVAEDAPARPPEVPEAAAAPSTWHPEPAGPPEARPSRGAWRTKERAELLQRLWPAGVDARATVEQMAALPGAPIPAPQRINVARWATYLGLRRSDAFLESLPAHARRMIAGRMRQPTADPAPEAPPREPEPVAAAAPAPPPPVSRAPQPAATGSMDPVEFVCAGKPITRPQMLDIAERMGVTFTGRNLDAINRLRARSGHPLIQAIA